MSEIQPGRILSDEYGTRYVELSSIYPSSFYWGDGIEHKVVGFDGECVGLMVHGETTARIVLTEQEFAVLVVSYQQYKADMERRQAELARVEVESFDPFLDE